MKNRILSLLLAAAALSSAAFAQTIDPAALEAARQAGTSAASGPRAIQVDAQGKPVLGADGKPVATPFGTGSLSDGLRMFQDMSGLSGVQVGAQPGLGRAGSATVTLNQSFTLNCRLTPANRVFTAGILSFQLTGCEMEPGSSAVVRAASFRVCDAATQAGTCTTPSDFNQPLRLVSGSFSNFNGLQAGLGCNSASECQVSVQGSYSVGGNDASLKAAAQEAGIRSGVVAALRDVVTEGGYAEKMTEIGRPLADCARANQDNPNGGAVGCDGETKVQIQSPSNSCSTTRECLKEAVSVQNFERVCQRAFPMTERQTKLSYDQTLTCEIETFKDPTKPSTNSCVTAENPNPTAGFTQVGKTEAVCTDGAETCSSTKYTEYWVNLDAPRELGSTANPSAVGGACDLRPNSPTRFESCDAWFGRTLDNAACTAQFTDEGTGLPAGGGMGFDFRTLAGCGFCTAPTVGVSCYGTNTPSALEQANGAEGSDSCSSLDLSACTFKSAQPMSFTSEGGLVQSQLETYSCRTETRQCVQWSAAGSDPSCLSQDMAMGTDKLARYGNASSESISTALVAAAMLDSTANGVESGSGGVPKLFTGTDMRCKRPAGGFGSFLSRNCCRTDLERPVKGSIVRDGCSFDEAKLAAARRSSYATYVGEYCSRSIKFLGARKCLQYTQTYCVFEGILPRLVQEQGRVQLRNITASSMFDSIQKAPIGFRYLDGSDTGSWSAPVTVNGVRVAAWQWPAYCETTEKANQKLVSDPYALACPGVVSTWFASCDNPRGCGPLPLNPEEGSFEWTLAQVNPLENATRAISRFAVATGACSTNTQACSYELSAWPVGTGGRAVVTRDLLWPLFAEQTPGQGEGTASPAEFQLSNVGDLMFRTYSQPGTAGGALPAQVRLDLSRDGGQTWTMYQVPTSQGTTEHTLAGDVKVIGKCDAATNECSFRATGTTVVSLKRPFYEESPVAPDCSGFTVGQLSVLDFSKMDLSEWLSTVMGQNGLTAAPADLAAAASAQFAEFNALFQRGEVRGTAPVAANFARALPAEGFGPFDVRLVVGGFWPEVTGDPALDTDTVISVRVDWGDCSAPENLERVLPTEGNGFRGTHRYQGPADRNPDTGSLQHGCLAAKYGGNLQQNLVHEVKLTVNTSKSGVQTRTLKVENAWARFPGATGNNVNNPIEVRGTTAASEVPAAPRP